MLISEIKKICAERIGRWYDTLVKCESTPLVLIGVEHNNNIGKIHVCLPEDVPSRAAGLVLLAAADELLEKKKGEERMPELPREIEIMRVMNLVQGFGWAKIKEEVVGTKIILTIEKEIFTEDEVTGGAPPS